VSQGAESVRIHYRRLPDRVQIFEQEVVARLEGGCVVTLLRAAAIRAPVRVDGRTVLEEGSPVLWFTYPEAWHDVGRFHLRDGTFTGIYANILTPVSMDTREWETTDLFLDVWLGPGEAPRLLDADELERARREGWIEPSLAERARAEAARLMEEAASGAWPPVEVAEWTLARVRGV
jgi:predicted RNA-binding protein associated with RNAse of E/G family